MAITSQKFPSTEGDLDVCATHRRWAIMGWEGNERFYGLPATERESLKREFDGLVCKMSVRQNFPQLFTTSERNSV